MNEMVERVARLLAKQRGVDPDQFQLGTGKTIRIWQGMVPDALEVIEAICVPTKAVDDARSQSRSRIVDS